MITARAPSQPTGIVSQTNACTEALGMKKATKPSQLTKASTSTGDRKVSKLLKVLIRFISFTSEFIQYWYLCSIIPGQLNCHIDVRARCKFVISCSRYKIECFKEQRRFIGSEVAWWLQTESSIPSDLAKPQLPHSDPTKRERVFDRIILELWRSYQHPSRVVSQSFSTYWLTAGAVQSPAEGQIPFSTRLAGTQLHSRQQLLSHPGKLPYTGTYSLHFQRAFQIRTRR